MSAVLDASAFYAGVPFGSSERYITTPEVYGEIAHIKRRQGAIRALRDAGRLRVISPNHTSLERVRCAAQTSGDAPSLSSADVTVLALAVQTHLPLITDDYAVSNTASELGVRAMPVMTGGIRRAGRWTYWCPACNSRRSPSHICGICGNPVRRRLLYGKAHAGPLNK